MQETPFSFGEPGSEAPRVGCGVSDPGGYPRGVVGGSCEDDSRSDGATNGRLGPGRKWFAWEAISAAMSPVERGRFEKNDGAREWRAGAGVVEAVKVSRELWRFAGVDVKTEYSSTKRGVQAPGSANRLSWGGPGVSNVVGLGKAAEAGVCRGVGG